MTSVTDRFWVKVDKTDTCWIWAGAKTSLGYGQFRREGRVEYAHRVAFELTAGVIPDGLVIDHLCRNASCVNPAHLEPVSQRVNVLRGEGLSARQAAQTHCSNGHELAGDNLILDAAGRKRRCRTCRQEWDRARRARKRDALACEHMERAEGWTA